MSIIIAILIFSIIILFHELGHFLLAKANGIQVNEFCLGLGPTLFGIQKGETKYSIKLLPFGGACIMEGEDERSEDSRSFSKASIPKRIAICLAGATVNIVFGIIVYFILMASSGTYISNEVDSVIDGYSAQTAGIQANDKIVEVDGKQLVKVVSWYDNEMSYTAQMVRTAKYLMTK